MPRQSYVDAPTLEANAPVTPWLWIWCRNCHCRHKAPLSFAPLISCCGVKGADLQHPSSRSSDMALAYHGRAEEWVDAVALQNVVAERNAIIPPELHRRHRMGEPRREPS
jgi:hypothetical protein